MKTKVSADVKFKPRPPNANDDLNNKFKRKLIEPNSVVTTINVTYWWYKYS